METITLQNIALQSTKWLQTFLRHGRCLMPYADETFKALYKRAKQELARRTNLDRGLEACRKINF